MLLLLMQVSERDATTARGVSVWVKDSDPSRALAQATAALHAIGLHVLKTGSIVETSADDYFRPCASQQAFMRAEAEGIAWRFDDDAE